MVHPCIPDYEGSGHELHLCHSTSAKRTVCKKKKLEPEDIDKSDGIDSMCPDCFPFPRTEPGNNDPVPIPGRP